MCVCAILIAVLSRYVPTEWLEKKELTLTEVDNLNKLNLELARTLSRNSNVFVPFQHGNFSCILVKDVSSTATVNGDLTHTHTLSLALSRYDHV